MSNLYVECPEGGFKIADDKIVLSAAESAVKRSLVRGVKFNTPADAKPWLVGLLGARPYEAFCMAYLDGNGALLAFDEMFRGSSSQVQVHPREVLRRAIELNSEFMIMVHNHPSGQPKFSDADIATTAKIGVAGAIMDICLVDHYLVAGDKVASFKEQCGSIGPDKFLDALKKGL